jgi:hypothetical protein
MTILLINYIYIYIHNIYVINNYICNKLKREIYLKLLRKMKKRATTKS